MRARPALPLLLLAGAALGLACARTDVIDPRASPPAGLLPDGGRPPDHQPLPDGGWLAPDAGPPCDLDSDCPRGYHCALGHCTLNGDLGQLQVTLSWNHPTRTPDDLDLHLIEPTPHGPCEIYFGDANTPDAPSTCGAVGSLDLDANAACNDTTPDGGFGADTENIIYPAGQPAPRGHYVVRVDYWERCTDGGPPVNYTLTVRHGERLDISTGTFYPDEVDQGGADAGRQVAAFDIP